MPLCLRSPICEMGARTLQASGQIHLVFSDELEAEGPNFVPGPPTLSFSSTGAFHRCLNLALLPTTQLAPGLQVHVGILPFLWTEKAHRDIL